MENKDPVTQRIEIVKGFVTDHEREAVIAAIVAALGAAAGATYVAVKKQPMLLSPWKTATTSRLGQSFADLRLQYQAKRQRD